MFDPDLLDDYEPSSLAETMIILCSCIAVLLIVFGIGVWVGGR